MACGIASSGISSGDYSLTVVPFAPRIVQGTWPFTFDAAQALGFYTYNTTGAAGDEISFDFFLAPGNYRVDLIGAKHNDGGDFTIRVDGTSIGTLNNFNAGGILYNQIWQIASFTNTYGNHVLSIKATGATRPRITCMTLTKI